MSEQPMISVEGLTKSFGGREALRGIDLEASAGQVLGVLGPNGAGKTTTVRVLSTLLRPDAGRIRVAGHDVVTDPEGVRRSIGLSGQYAAVDEKLTGFENLYMVGRLYGMNKRKARQRATALLGRFSLEDVAGQLSRTYSGGMRRRLDLAGALVAAPPVVVLDEPTTGLDPRGRLDTWGVISDLVLDGTSVLLTTQYLEEADQLADLIVVIDAGRVIARGTADDLKDQVGQGRLDLVVEHTHQRGEAARILDRITRSIVDDSDGSRRLSVAAPHGQHTLRQVLGELDQQGIAVLEAALRRPTLDDVFLELTGHSAQADDDIDSVPIPEEVPV